MTISAFMLAGCLNLTTALFRTRHDKLHGSDLFLTSAFVIAGSLNFGTARVVLARKRRAMAMRARGVLPLQRETTPHEMVDSKDMTVTEKTST